MVGHRVRTVLGVDFTQMLSEHSINRGMILRIIRPTRQGQFNSASQVRRSTSITSSTNRNRLMIGTSLDVFCIIPNPSDPGLTSTYNLTFELDGQPLEQTFTHESDSSNVFLFNTSVLSLENLTLAPHMFVMLAASTVVNSTLLFDYAMYT